MIIDCTQCGRKGTLAGESYSGKKVRLKCPYCSQAFLYSVPQNGNSPLASVAPPAHPEPTVVPPPVVQAPIVQPPVIQAPVVQAQVAPAPVAPPPEVQAPPPAPPPEVSDAVVNEAKRIARLVISEIKLYNQDKIARAKTRREVLDLLKNDLIKGKQHYNSRVGSKLPAGPDYFMETVKEILLAGKN